jgi:AhpD family alkylhydroperoxidase
MMQDWNAYREALLVRVTEYAQLSPDVTRGMTIASGSAGKTGKLEPRVQELIALAVAVTTRCDGCVAIHTKRAVERGATREEIAEALGVAISLNAGAALTYSARVLDAHAALSDEDAELVSGQRAVK